MNFSKLSKILYILVILTSGMIFSACVPDENVRPDQIAKPFLGKLTNVNWNDVPATTNQLEAVKVFRGNRRITPVHIGMSLYVGDQVVTTGATTAFITLRDGSKIMLNKRTDIVIQNPIIKVIIKIGEVFLKVKGRFIVEDQYGAAISEGTEYLVTKRNNEHFKVSVFEGRVRVESYLTSKPKWSPTFLIAGKGVTRRNQQIISKIYKVNQKEYKRTMRWVQPLTHTVRRDLADLVVEQIFLEKGGYKRAWIANRGTADASNVNVNFYINGSLTDTYRSITIARGQRFKVTASRFPSGSAHVRVFVDSNNSVTESNEKNNSLSTTLKYSPEPSGETTTPTSPPPQVIQDIIGGLIVGAIGGRKPDVDDSTVATRPRPRPEPEPGQPRPLGKPDVEVINFVITGAVKVVYRGGPNKMIAPVKVVIRNNGSISAGSFKVAIEFAESGSSSWYYLQFSDSGKVNTGYQSTTRNLLPGNRVALEGDVVFPIAKSGNTFSLRAIVDSCSGEEFMPSYCRINESNESNNTSKPISLKLPHYVY